MTEHGILFNATMVRALLDGTKTQTRRPCKPMNQWIDQECREVRMVDGAPHHFMKGATAPLEKLHCPYGQPGDRLWVRETWQHSNFPAGPYEPSCDVFYRADYMDDPHGPGGERSLEGKYRTWRPSIHMPRAASRILLEITSVHVERLQELDDVDARAEGIEPNWMGDLTKGPNGFGAQGWVPECGWRHYLNSVDGEPAYTSMESYRTLWESINGAGSWDANPWVWVVNFKRI